MPDKKKIFMRMLMYALSVITAASLSTIKNPGKKAGAAIGGAGTASDPYTINSEADLRQLAGYINTGATPWRYPDKYYLLTADIELSENWTPIGTSVWLFSGTLDGGGHRIKGLNINGGLSYQGLFGYINGGTVRNLGIEGASVNGTANIGGFTGYIKNGAITNCYFTGSVNGTGSVIGGIAGAVDAGAVISGCYVIGSVSGKTSAGGIAGYPHASTIKNCYTKCAVSGAGSDIGGIVGIGLETSVENCYAAGAVSAADDTGGLAGNLFYNTSFMKNSVALNPSVSADARTGRVVGNNSGGPALSNNYALTGVKNISGDTTWSDKGHNKRDGQDIGFDDVMSSSFWADTVNWPADIWYIEDGKLPVLKNAGGPQEGGLPEDFRTSVSSAVVTVTPDSYTYTGALIMPETVTVSVLGKTLVEGKDYTLSITSADGAGISAGVKTGEVTITVTGIGVYKDTADGSYIIVKADPPYTVPDGLTAYYGQLLSGVELPGGWVWENVSMPVGSPGAQIHKAAFTPADTVNFNNVTGVDITVTVVKAVFVVSITHSIDGMSATVLIAARGGTLRNQEFEREGYTFMGLYTDAAMTREYDASSAVTEDTVLYAKWERAPKAAARYKGMTVVLSLAAAAAGIFIGICIYEAKRERRTDK